MSINEMLMAAAGQAGGANEYVEDVFSTYLYTGTGATLSINNGIDLSGEGGLVWCKLRDTTNLHSLVDTARGASKWLGSSNTSAEQTYSDAITSFNNNGFTLGADATGGYVNASGYTFASWTFRKAPKFFDVVTFTSTEISNQRISHSLGSVPGMIFVKKTSGAGSWFVYHRSEGRGKYLALQSTIASQTQSNFWGTSDPTSTDFGLDTANVAASGDSLVAYLFAHDAGGFGAAGTDNIISCGSFTSDGNGEATINLGYEPQYVLLKRTDSTGDWILMDVMRGMTAPPSSKQTFLEPNTSDAEATTDIYTAPTSTGMYFSGFANRTFIYMAIRRPMKTPTSGTEVFSPTYVSAVSTGTKSTTGFPIDLQILSYATGTTENQTFVDRLRGVSTNATESGSYLISSSTAAEATSPAETRFWDNTGFQQHSYFSGGAARYWNFRRAPGFFDVVCYTGTGSATTQAHNLGVAPELIIVKQRNSTNPWRVYSAPTLATTHLALNTDAATTTSSANWNDTAPTSSVFTVGTGTGVNGSGSTYVAYLFATVAGVSKVGSYTGTGSTQTINCGFSAGARFVMIKRTDSTGDWYVWDTARGIVSGNDPYLLLNSTAAEVTNTDYIDPANSGFQISSTAPAAINANGGSFIFLAIA